ncbi:MAG TPA: endo alpha-1,4 polygalactosaminidase, partial [Gaiellales bacterium]|nr:endo alpha-1,4 polygalactosaminidase [Gaiellales bacterium]
VAYEWRSCPPSGGRCRPGGGTTATPFAASQYTVAHSDTGRRLKLVETATEVVETDPATFSFRVLRASRHVLARAVVAAYPRGRAPATAFVNGLPPASTGSASERFTVSGPHFNAADGRPRLRYRIDGRAWRGVPRRKVVATGPLGLGSHTIAVRAANAAGQTTRRFAWRVVPLPAPVACQGTCWAPPHLDSTGHPMRWDWQIGRVAPLQRTGARAVDIYDIDGFLTTRAEVRALHTTWQASTLPHPRAACYLDLAWEDYRPDATPSPNGFPAAALGRVYFGFPQERWVDMRRVAAVMRVFDARIAMCARKGFDAVEIDDIDSFNPPGTTGFQLTRGDVQNLLARIDNRIHRAGMTALWKNSGILAWWGRRYTDGAVVEECYQFDECFAAQLAGSTQFGFTCTGLGGAHPCGYDAFTSQGKWVGEAEYREDGFVCGPNQSCKPRHRFSTYCNTVYAPPNGFSAVKFSDELDGSLFRPCPNGR